MRRSKRLCRRPALPLALVLAGVAAAPVAVAETVWPEPPATPIVRLESTLSRLNAFEVAVQGPLEGKPKRIQKLGRPAGIAFDGRGRLLVSDARHDALLQIDTDLGVVLVFGTGTSPKLREPGGVAAHPDGRIYVADSGLRQVVAFDPRGHVVARYGEGLLQEPTDVALSPVGDRIYVADGRANRVVVFDLDSRQRVDTLGGKGIGIGKFYLPTAVEFDRAGSLLVVDQLNERVQVFDPGGGFARLVELGGGGGASRPQDVAAAGSGRVFVSDSAQSRVQVYDSRLDPLLSFGRNGLGEGEFLGVGGIAVRGDRLAVLDRAGGRVQLFRLYGAPEPPAQARTAARAPAAPEPASRPGGEAAAVMPAPEAAPEAPPAPTPEAPPAPSAGASAPIEATTLLAAEPEPRALPSAEPAEAAAGEPIAAAPPARGGAGPAAEPGGLAEETRVAQQLLELVNEWAAAWSAQDADRYLGFYASSFRPADGSSREAWSERRRNRVTAPGSIEVGIEIVQTRVEGDSAEVTFLQSYRSDRYADRVRKSLALIKQGGAWKIDRETVLETF